MLDSYGKKFPVEKGVHEDLEANEYRDNVPPRRSKGSDFQIL
jgi:hypothetical protein